MKPKPITVPLIVLALTLLLASSNAVAERLELPTDASIWAHWGADILLWSHIGGGALGLVSGLIAVLVAKGKPLHRLAGKVFVFSMAVTFLVGAGVAPFLNEGQRPNFVAAVLSLYLLATGVMAAKRRPFTAGSAEWFGLFLALSITMIGVLFMNAGMNSPTGTVDGSPPQAFVLFNVVGGLATLGEVNVLLRRTLSQSARIVRHLWRMCLAFFFASGSLFLGQPQVFSESFNESVFPLLFAFLPLIAAVIWVVKVKWSGRVAVKLG